MPIKAEPTDSIRPLKDRVIVIVGGTTGLGLSAAKACVASGGRVVVVGRSEDSAATAVDLLGNNAIAFVGDAIESLTSVQAIEKAVNEFGQFDALYHVAGGSGRRFGDGPLHEVTDEGIDRTLDLNLKSVIRSNRAALQHFLQNGQSGVVLNMGSVLGYSPSPKHFSTHVYAAAKSAIIGFTKSCAARYAGDNIRFNVIAPALFETPMSQRAVGDETIREFVAAKQPLDGGRVGNPEDLDGAVVYLLSQQSQFVTGQVLAVDGGWTVSEGR